MYQLLQEKFPSSQDSLDGCPFNVSLEHAMLTPLKFFLHHVVERPFICLFYLLSRSCTPEDRAGTLFSTFPNVLNK